MKIICLDQEVVALWESAMDKHRKLKTLRPMPS